MCIKRSPKGAVLYRETDNKSYQQYQKCNIRLSGIWNTHTHTLGSIQMYFWAWCCLQGSFVQRVADGMLQTAVYSQAESYWISARLTTFFTVCAAAEFFQGLLCGSKRKLSCLILLSTLSLTPQPAQRTSYFKGQDGRLSQVTSFYRSTRRTSALPSRVRQKAVLLHSIGKLPHQSCASHKSLFPSTRFECSAY